MDERSQPKAVYQELAEREQEHDQLISAMREGYALGELIPGEDGKPRDCRFLEVNPAFLRLTGLGARDIVGRSLQELLPAVVSRWLAHCGEIAPGGEPARFEERAIGSDEWLEISIHSPAPGRVVYLMSTVAAPTCAETSAQSPLRDFYGDILDNIVDGVWVADANDVIFYANRGMAVIAGIPAEQLKGANVLSGFSDQTLAYFRPYYMRAKAGSVPVRYEAVPVVTPQGRSTFQSGWLIPFRKAGALEGVICTVEDITERLTAERALRESERRIRLITDNLPVLISYVDPELRYKFNNATYEKWFGIPRQEIYGRHIEDVLGKGNFAMVAEHYRRALNGETVRFLTRMPFHNGRERESEVVVVPDRGEGGGVLGLYIMAQDIADLLEHKRAVEALRASETRYRNLFENMADGYGLAEALVDERGIPCDFRILDVNPSFERMLALPREAVIDKTVREVMPGLERYWLEMLGRTALTGLPERLEQYAGPFARHFEANTSCPQHGLVAVFLRDVSERKRSEEALRTSERLLRVALDHFPGALAIYDSERRYQYVNAFGREVSGLSLEEHVGHRDEEIRGSDITRAFLPLLLKVYETGEAQRQESWVALPNGAYAISLAYVPILDEHDRVRQVLGIALDITDRKRAEDELRHAYDRLEETVAELRRTQQQVIRAEKRAALWTMTAGIAHELNNPMMGVMNYVTYARERVEDPTLGRVLDSASRELVRMRDLLREMISITRPFDEPSHMVEVQVVINQVLDSLKPDFSARQITVEKHLAPNVSGILIKEAQLQQALLHVLTNARNALRDTAVKRIEIYVYLTEGELHIDVRDTGHGIPREIQERIFDPFFTTSAPGEGTGLGLTIARKVINEVGGRISVDSELGKGALFKMTLPVEQVDSGPDKTQ